MIYIMDANGFKEQKSFELRGTPCFLNVSGVLSEEWRICVAVRENQIILITNGMIENFVIDLNSKPVGMI